MSGVGISAVAAAEADVAVGGKRKAPLQLQSPTAARQKVALSLKTDDAKYAKFSLYVMNDSSNRFVVGVPGRFPTFVALANEAEELTPLQKNVAAAALKCRADGTPEPYLYTDAPIAWSENDDKSYVTLSVRYTKENLPVLAVPTRNGVLYARLHVAGRRRSGTDLVTADEVLPDSDPASVPPLSVCEPIAWLPPVDPALSAICPTTPTASVPDAVPALNADAEEAFAAFVSA